MSDEIRKILLQLQDAARADLLKASDQQYNELMERFDGESESHRIVRGFIEIDRSIAKLIASVNLNEIPSLMLQIMIMAMEKESDLMEIIFHLKEDGLEEWTPDA